MLSGLRKKRKGAIAKVRDRFGAGACFELLVYLSNKNVYGQVVNLADRRVIFSASSVAEIDGEKATDKYKKWRNCWENFGFKVQRTGHQRCCF